MSKYNLSPSIKTSINIETQTVTFTLSKTNVNAEAMREFLAQAYMALGASVVCFESRGGLHLEVYPTERYFKEFGFKP